MTNGLNDNYGRIKMKWIKLEDLKIDKSQFIYVYAHDIVNSWVEVIEAYRCPEYGFIELLDADGEDYVPIVLAVALIDKDSLPSKPEGF